ncbi:hypothetical protein [Subtercola vilae]|uniref:DUF2231 domain-containing protein n=1 Tax=Subtercola vilae TaxID=2056433 RepID=A0A4V4RGL0_9MICO|nr:hypothetical protein [Subtercola vilae]TIH40364.1 hypothetical protein D4765_02085 [Subtercola vilae]
MLPYEINGLPLHILLVHFVVIVIPAGALMTAAGAVWPAFRRKLGIVTPIVTLLGLLSVPLATNAGEWLQQRVGATPLIAAHVALGDTLLPWAIAQFLVSLVIWGWYRFFAASKAFPDAPVRRVSELVPVGGDTGGATRADARPAAPGLNGSAAAASAAVTAESAAAPRRRASLAVSLVVSIVLIVAGVGISAGTFYKVVQIGESGSSAVWQGSFSENPK